MPVFSTKDFTKLYYEEQGKGQAVRQMLNA